MTKECAKCGRCSEYDSPEILCRYCWAEWWVATDNNPTRRRREIRRILAHDIKRYGTPPDGILKSYHAFPVSPKPASKRARQQYQQSLDDYANRIAAMEENELWLKRPLQPPHKPINPQGKGMERYGAALEKYHRKMKARGFIGA